MDKRHKVVFFGEAETGKTTTMMAMKGIDHPSAYTPTIGVNVIEIDKEGNMYTFWDTAGDPEFTGLRDGYFIGGDIGVVFYRDRKTYMAGNSWIRDFKRVCEENTPVIWCYYRFDNNTGNFRKKTCTVSKGNYQELWTALDRAKGRLQTNTVISSLNGDDDHHHHRASS